MLMDMCGYDSHSPNYVTAYSVQQHLYHTLWSATSYRIQLLITWGVGEREAIQKGLIPKNGTE
jgi:hypothetical protein